MIHLSTIIDKINLLNHNQIFDSQKLLDVEEFLNTYSDQLVYCNHGSHTLCFRDGKEYVVKILKRHNSVTSTSYRFLEYIQKLKDSEINVLEIEILYENHDHIVYRQPFCQTVNREDINYKFVRDVLLILLQFAGQDIILPDTYYRNFGYYKNSLYLFDLHDDNIKDIASFKFHLVGLYSLFSLLLIKKDETDLSNIIKINLGENVFPDCVYNLLNSYYQKGTTSIKIYLQSCIDYLGRGLTTSLHNYQYLDINDQGHIMLHNHTLQKFLLVQKIINEYLKIDTFSLLDAGCSIGSIGLKISQSYHDSSITLNNLNKNELELSRVLSQKLWLLNTTFRNGNVFSIQTKFDISLYFALIHHLLKNMTFNQLVEMIKIQTDKYFILECPLKGDYLLEDLSKSLSDPWKVEYRYLIDLETITKRIEQDFKILEIIEMDYKNVNILRYSFLCETI